MAIIFGTAGNDTRKGTTGSDEIYGLEGNDNLNGGGTATIDDFDYLDGGDGNDRLTIKGAGVALGGAGNDELRFVASDPDIDFMEAGYWTAQRGIVANLTSVARGGVAAGNNSVGFAVNDGLGGVDRLFGVHEISDSEHGDTFFVDQTYQNTYDSVGIQLGAGNDYVRAFGGAHVLVMYRNADGAVRADLQEEYATDLVDTNLFIGYDRLVGVTDLRGGAFGDELSGNAAANQIRGRQGNDKIYGRDGDDRLFGDNRQNDSMTGNDILDGGAGNDLLGGGNGKDTMTGGANDDIFYFGVNSHSRTGSNADVITDFDDRGNDTIDVSELFGPDMTYRHNSAFTAAGQVRVKVDGADVLVEVNTGGTLAADFAIRLTDTSLGSMAANDFFL